MQFMLHSDTVKSIRNCTFECIKTNFMITVSEAFSILQNNLPTPKEENCSLLEARKRHFLSPSILQSTCRLFDNRLWMVMRLVYTIS